jgi:hypothetical protein
MTKDDWDEYAIYWWGPETDGLSIADAIDSGVMTEFILDLLNKQKLEAQ